jgi:tricorn protease
MVMIRLYFASARQVWHSFLQQLFEVNINTGIDQMLAMPEASQGSVSPDGKYTAYIRSVDINEWANFRLYRGGDKLRVWIFNNQTHDIEEIPAANSNSSMPVWTDNNTIYFLSDRDNHYINVYTYNLTSKAVAQVTTFKDFDVKTLYANGSELAFEQAGINIFTKCSKWPVNTCVNIDTGRHDLKAALFCRCRW